MLSGTSPMVDGSNGCHRPCSVAMTAFAGLTSMASGMSSWPARLTMASSSSCEEAFGFCTGYSMPGNFSPNEASTPL